MDIQEVVSGIASGGALNEAASRVGIDPDQAESILHGVLEHVTGTGSAEGVAEAVAAKVGISPDQVQAFLPQIMPLLEGHSENAQAAVQGVLGGITQSLGGFLGQSGSAESASGGLLGLAKGLFGSRG